MPNKTYVLVKLEVANGEYKYDCISTHTVPAKSTKERVAEEHARTFYSGNPDAGDGGYYFHGGCVHVQVNSVHEITKKEYQVFHKFCI